MEAMPEGKIGSGEATAARQADVAPIAQREVAAVAGFGPPPRGLLGSIPYALRVRRRQKELRASLADINARLAKAETRRNRAESQIGQVAVDQGLVTADGARDLTTKVQEAERSLAAARSRTTKDADKYAADTKRLEAEESTVKDVLARMIEHERGILDETAVAQTDHQRSEAKLHRAQIEMRNLDEIVAHGDRTAEAEGRRPEILVQLAQAEKQARDHGAVVARLGDELAALRQNIEAVKVRLDEIDQERQKIDGEYEERLGLHSETTRRASTWRRSRLAAIGREVHDRKPPPTLPGGARLFADVEYARNEMAEVEREAELNIRALDAFDRGAVARAKVAMLVAGGILLVGALVAVAASC